MAEVIPFPSRREPIIPALPAEADTARDRYYRACLALAMSVPADMLAEYFEHLPPPPDGAA